MEIPNNNRTPNSKRSYHNKAKLVMQSNHKIQSSPKLKQIKFFNIKLKKQNDANLSFVKVVYFYIALSYNEFSNKITNNISNLIRYSNLI